MRHAIVFNWSFADAADLAAVAANLTRELFYVLNPEANVLAVTSKTRPGVVIFTIIQRDTFGGELILIQTPDGQYTFRELNRNIRIFGNKVGIIVTPRSPAATNTTGKARDQTAASHE